MIVQPRTVIPGTVAGRSMLLSPAVKPYTVSPRTQGAPDWDAQRFYFRASTPAEVSPVFDGAWTNTTDSLRRHLAPEKTGLADVIGLYETVTWTAGQVRLHRQYVGPMMRPGVSFADATVSCAIAAIESANDDNSFLRFGLRVVSADGLVPRATLLAVGGYGSDTELTVTSTASSHVVANAEPLAAYVTQAGDRFVAEIGFTDAAGTTPSGRAAWGTIGSAADLALADDNTFVASNPWIEITPPAA